MEINKNKTVKELSLEFSVLLLGYMANTKKKPKFLSTNQLVRSGTGVGANIREAQGAESRSDFIHKMKIAYKEAEETAYWIELFNTAAPHEDLAEMLDKIIQIKKMLSRIISTTIKNTNKNL